MQNEPINDPQIELDHDPRHSQELPSAKITIYHIGEGKIKMIFLYNESYGQDGKYTVKFQPEYQVSKGTSESQAKQLITDAVANCCNKLHENKSNRIYWLAATMFSTYPKENLQTQIMKILEALGSH